MSRSVILSLLYACVCMPILIWSLGTVTAQVMSSSNYQIQSDSINVGGGLSSSTNFISESTLGEVGTGPSESNEYSLRAGYQQMQEVYIALTGAANVSLSPSIPGITGGTANGSTTVLVTTDSPSGYQLTIASEETPAMQSGANSISDYVPAGVPDFDFTIDATDAYFGYTPEGVDVVQRFLDDGNDCNVAGGDTELKCWDGLSVTPEVIASSVNANHPNGATTTVRFRVGVGSAVVQSPGLYTATTTVTAMSL